MASAAPSPGKIAKERSPSFPFIPLQTALERLISFELKFGRHPAPAAKAGIAWSMKEDSSQAQQTLAALKAFGLVEYQGASKDRHAVISEDGRNFLRAQQESVKNEIVRRVALKPKMIDHYWRDWGADRPPREVCLDQLVLKGGFTQSAAETFLRVYDATIAYAGLTDSDTEEQPDGEDNGFVQPPNQDIAVGDWVRVESGGQIVFEKTRVRAINDPWIFVEASTAGAKMSDVSLVEKGGPAVDQPPVLPFAPASETKPQEGEEMDRFTVDEGVVKISFPSGMTPASVEELEQFFNLFIKKAKRRAGAEKPN